MNHDEHAVLGGRRVDWIGRLAPRPSSWETASQFDGIRVTPNIYTTLKELDLFCERIQEVAKNGLPA